MVVYEIADVIDSKHAPALQTVAYDRSIHGVLEEMFEEDHSQLGVRRNGDLAGVVSFRSVARALEVVDEIAVDANIWVYYFDARLAEHEAVRPWLRDVLAERTLFVNTAIQMEVVRYFSNQLEDTEAYTERFLSLDGLVVTALEQCDVSRAGELLVSHPHVGIGGRDASLVATVERREVDELRTHDTGLQRLGERLNWLTVTDPAGEAPDEQFNSRV